MNDKQREALFGLFSIVKYIMCDTCHYPSSHCHNCETIGWLTECQSQFEEDNE